MRHRLLHKSVVLLFISGAPSCSDLAVQPKAVPLALVEPLIDAGKLKALDARTLSPGDRVSLEAIAAASNAVDAKNVVSRDTAVISVDAAGVLFARAAGNTWLFWSAQSGADSAKLTVASAQSTAALQQDYVVPEPPKEPDVRYPTGRSRGLGAVKSWRVEQGGDLQTALDSAQPGDEVVLANGAIFTGNFILPNKQSSGSDWIIVRSESVGVAAGTRVSPDALTGVAKIVTPNQEAALRTAPGAHRWRLVGMEVAHAQGAIYNYGIVVLGRGDETALAQQPSDVVLDRMYIHGSPTDGTSRCVAFNGRALAVIDSWLSECHAKGFDAQGVGGWGGGGPFLIENNYIQASGEIVLFGGADPRIANVSPSDITIRHNYLVRPLSWAGQWTIKNIFELKHGKRVLFEGNVLENNWADGQTGFAILFQTLADDNTSWSWTTVQDVMVRNNIIKNSTGGVNILARVAYNGGPLPTNPTSRVVVLNNVFQDVGHDPITGVPGRIFQLLADLRDVSLVNNTVSLVGSAQQAVLLDGGPSTRTTIANNVFPNTQYGIFATGKAIGLQSIASYAPDGLVVGNVFPGQQAEAYPPGNYFPQSPVSSTVTGAIPSCRATRDWLDQLSIPLAIGTSCEAVGGTTSNVTSKP